MGATPLATSRIQRKDFVHSKTPEGKQRYRCQTAKYQRGTFIRDYRYAGLLSEVKLWLGQSSICHN